MATTKHTRRKYTNIRINQRKWQKPSRMKIGCDALLWSALRRCARCTRCTRCTVCACIFHHWAYAMCFDDPTARPILDCIYHQFGQTIYNGHDGEFFAQQRPLTATKSPCRDIKVQTYKMCATFYSTSFSFGLLLTVPIQDICGLRLKKLIDWVASLAHTPAIEIAGDAQTSKSNNKKKKIRRKDERGEKKNMSENGICWYEKHRILSICLWCGIHMIQMSANMVHAPISHTHTHNGNTSGYNTW